MKYRDVIIFAILLAIAIAFPWMGVKRYLIASALIMFCYATVVSQWNLVFGVAGIFSLAQLAIFAFGAYTTAHDGPLPGLEPVAHLPRWPVLAGVVFSIFIGLACLRMRGIYVALLTLAISQTMFVLIQTDSELQRRSTRGDQSSQPASRSPAARRGSGDFGNFGWREVLGRAQLDDRRLLLDARRSSSSHLSLRWR